MSSSRLEVRDLCEMIGMVKGVLADGVVNDQEAEALRVWTMAHPDVSAAWPGSVLSERLWRIFEDGNVSEAERADLKSLLEDLVGGVDGIICGATAPTDLPLDDPPPEVEVTDQVFVLTGCFAFGPRAACKEALRRIGGWTEPNVTQRTDFLVIGTFASRGWKASSIGNKILKAADYREKHGRPKIIGEDHWAAHV